MLKSTNEEQNQIIALLINASSKKSYLSIVAYLILLDFINTVSIFIKLLFFKSLFSTDIVIKNVYIKIVYLMETFT